MFEFVTGVMNIQYWYAFRFNFVVAHYYGAIVFVASLVLHVAVKMPVIVRAYRGEPRRERPHATSSAPAPAPRRRSRRRGLFALVGAGSLALLVANVGETIGGPLRRLSLLAPRRQVIGPGPNDFQVNKTARGAGITPAMTGPDYRLALRSGGRELIAHAARSCWRWSSTRRGCRSPASRAGRRRRSGPACGSPTSRGGAGAERAGTRARALAAAARRAAARRR